MPLIRKKKFGSTAWTFDAKSQVQLKRVFNTDDKQNDWPLESVEEVIYRTEDDLLKDLSYEYYFTILVKAIARIKSTNLRFNFIWALKRFPEEKNKVYAIFIDESDFIDEDLSFLFENNLILAKYSKFYIITCSNDVKFFEKAIEFYERFDQLVLPDKTEPFLLYGTKNEYESVLLFYCDVGGNGMLIKSKGLESKISPEREIEILRLGAIVGVDVPQRSAVIKLDPEDDIVTAFSANNNILIQKLISGAFPLYSATDENIDILTKSNCSNLGKMVIFDIVAGSWDRHSGNYVIHPGGGINEFSLAEIDFGLFDPSWYPPTDFVEDETITLDPNETPPVYSPRIGWALTRHPSVTEMVKKCDQKKVIKGIETALHKLKQFLKNTENIDEIFSKDLSDRIEDLFKKDSKVRNLLESELNKINIYINLFQ